MLAATPQFEIPGWAIVVAMVIAFAVLGATIALVVFGFRFAVRAGAGDDRARNSWLALMVVELALGMLRNEPRALALSGTLIGFQVLTFLVTRFLAGGRPGFDTPPPRPDAGPRPGGDPGPGPGTGDT